MGGEPGGMHSTNGRESSLQGTALGLDFLQKMDLIPNCYYDKCLNLLFTAGGCGCMQLWDKAPLSLGGIATQGPLVRHLKIRGGPKRGVRPPADSPLARYRHLCHPLQLGRCLSPGRSNTAGAITSPQGKDSPPNHLPKAAQETW